MRRRGYWIGIGVLTLSLCWLVGEARALITALTPMKSVLADSQFVAVAKVDHFDPQKAVAVLTITEDLKGKLPPRRLPLNLAGDTEAKKLNHPAQILKRLAVGLPVVLFVWEKDEKYMAFAYTNGTWFLMVAEKRDDGKSVWALAHGEPFLRRTFKGTTAEMRQVIVDGLQDKKKLPGVSKDEPPGFGPEVPQKSSRHHEPLVPAVPEGEPRPLFGVIPTLGIGGPLAILAILFPSLFGGVLVLFRRWLAFFTVISTVSTLYLLHAWQRGNYWGEWWTKPSALWAALLAITALGALWAWQRHIRALNTEPDAIEPPRRTELIVLWTMTFSCVALLAYYLFLDRPTFFGSWWDLLLAFSFAIWVGTLYKVVWVLSHPQPAAAPVADPLAVAAPALSLQPAGGPALSGDNLLMLEHSDPAMTNGHNDGGLSFLPPAPPVVRRSPLPTEGVMLWVALVACVAFTLLRPGSNEVAADQDAAGKDRQAAVLQESDVWHFKFNSGDSSFNMLSSPLIVGDRVYASVTRGGGAQARGMLFCFDLKTRLPLWETLKDGDKQRGSISMKQIFSSPAYADGYLYIGEGLHQDTGCCVYCIDANTGLLKWKSKPTNSHTEATPVVVGGKVYTGAGDDGVLCLDAKTGDQLWQFPEPGAKELHLHVDADLAVADGKVYGCAGIDEDAQTPDGLGDPAIFCLDAATGKKLWLHRTPQLMKLKGDSSGKKLHLPGWGGPVVDNGQVFFGLGNGRITISSNVFEPIGAVLAVDAATGKHLWEPFVVGDGVLRSVAVDRLRIYFGSRDGFLYCVGRNDGKLRWKKNLGSPVVATPALDVTAPNARANMVFAIATGGRVSCIDAYTGKAHWNYTKLEEPGTLLGSSPALTITATAQGERRRLCFGTSEDELSIANLYFVEDLLPDR